MLLNQDEAHVLSGGDQIETAGYSAAANSKMFSLLTSGLYSNKIGSVCRELISNQWDAHSDAGRLDKPFKITAPTMLELQCSFRDYGKGISHKAMMTEYPVLFLSSKEFTNYAIGCFGIGRMTPLAMSDSYIVVSRHEGTKATYNVYMDETKAPRIMLVSKEDCYTSGFEVIVPCKMSDVQEWQDEIIQYIKYLEVQPETNFEYTTPEPFLKEDPWELFAEPRPVNSWGSRVASTFKVRQGITCYTLDISQLDGGRDSATISSSIVVDVPIGTFQVTLSREDIEYDTRTKTNLTKVFDDTMQRVFAVARTELDSSTKTPLDRVTEFKELRKIIKLPKNSTYTYNGEVYYHRGDFRVASGHVDPKHFPKYEDDFKLHGYRYDKYAVPYKPKFRLDAVHMSSFKHLTTPASYRETNHFQENEVDQIIFFTRTTNRWRARLMANRDATLKDKTVCFVSAAPNETLAGAVKAFEDEWGAKVLDFDTWGLDPITNKKGQRQYLSTPIFSLGHNTWYNYDQPFLQGLLDAKEVKYYVRINRFSTCLGDVNLERVDTYALMKYLKEQKILLDNDVIYGIPKGNWGLIDELDSTWKDIASVIADNKTALTKIIRKENAYKRFIVFASRLRIAGKEIDTLHPMFTTSKGALVGDKLSRTYHRLMSLSKGTPSKDEAIVSLPYLQRILKIPTGRAILTTQAEDLLVKKLDEVEATARILLEDPVVTGVLRKRYSSLDLSQQEKGITKYTDLTKEVKELRAKVALLETLQKGTY